MRRLPRPHRTCTASVPPSTLACVRFTRFASGTTAAAAAAVPLLGGGGMRLLTTARSSGMQIRFGGAVGVRRCTRVKKT